MGVLRFLSCLSCANVAERRGVGSKTTWRNLWSSNGLEPAVRATPCTPAPIPAPVTTGISASTWPIGSDCSRLSPTATPSRPDSATSSAAGNAASWWIRSLPTATRLAITSVRLRRKGTERSTDPKTPCPAAATSLGAIENYAGLVSFVNFGLISARTLFHIFRKFFHRDASQLGQFRRVAHVAHESLAFPDGHALIPDAYEVRRPDWPAQLLYRPQHRWNPFLHTRTYNVPPIPYHIKICGARCLDTLPATRYALIQLGREWR